MITASQRIYDAALTFRGVCEVPGPKSNKLIQGWIREAAIWLDSDDSKTAWCGCFRGHLGLITATGVPKEHFRALNWMMWGKPVDPKNLFIWQKGDTIILKRKGGAHVTLFDSIADPKAIVPKSINCLGGNQSDKVCIAPFKIADVLGVRRAS